MTRRTLFGIGISLGATAVVVAATVALVGLFVLQRPGPLGQGPTTNIKLETTGAVGSALFWPRPNDPHPDWVGYLPTTTFQVPANSVIHMTIYMSDSATGLRNPFWSQVQGVAGGTVQMKYYDSNGNLTQGNVSTIDPTQAGHTFSIPTSASSCRCWV